MMRGKKKVKKVFRYHTGYIGHMREIKYANFMEDKPEQIVRFHNCRLRGVWTNRCLKTDCVKRGWRNCKFTGLMKHLTNSYLMYLFFILVHFGKREWGDKGN
jgi:hypothetical protein